ncbi:MAG: ribonuclease HII [Nitrospirae bacterium CG_4_10_14_0_8_um_filter_41_23]|nr:MAG: ribonuclease HII [Nitrospirae bacterium CG11_big_fil_rev_8_21_14_0_20_41_14]PIV42910.1 MAG: ribonuclease HII [Nitrospirae bacterium CG02_land_8_20_14_3_00_41_53]PIW87791.1 MAG: ribonuclease HII [Nitrospirae bacterium CG_4_8_14_3_um_filter_41_47]PIY86902.1 MAG: ribonuclease HII [Nitrospirae bacterium CG_4_10_14_0_8_um_filter_41_23]PJA79597.1 MAG: ribonuclease HII [Nitrospirae bacterium CG_4_9_14_3_um_filter_41_27]
MDIYQYDESLRKKGFLRIAGIDEAGRGTLAGPVVAAAVVLNEGVKIDRLRDSKKVPEKEREILFYKIQSSSTDIGIGIVGPEEIDRLNILRATRLSMQLAVEDLSTPPDILIIDAVSLPSIPIKQLSPVKGESISASVAAASIIAKFVRDKIMLDYHRQYPDYNFKKHKGYSTREHLDMLQVYGPCPIHRKTFHGVMSLELPF